MTAFNTWFPTSLRGMAVYNVVGYGADPSGNNSSTSSIQAAIDAAIDAGGGTVYFPTGEYLVTAPLVFTHNIPEGGNTYIDFLGEPSTDNLFGSRIFGTVSGYIIDQTDFDTFTVGTVSNGPFVVNERIQNQRTSGYTNPLVAVAGSILTAHGGGPEGPSWVGDTVVGENSGASATVQSLTMAKMGLRNVQYLNITNYSSAAGSGALRMEGGLNGAIDGCFLAGKNGLSISSNDYCISCRNTKFQGPSYAAGSVGAYVIQASFTNCDFSGWEEGIRAWGVHLCVINTRMESNKTSIKTGVDALGNNYSLGSAFISGVQTENVDTSINLFSVGCVIVVGCYLTNQGVAPSGSEAIDGIVFNGVQYGVIAGTTWGGPASGAGFRIAGINNIVTFISCKSTNSGSGVAYTLPATNDANAHLNNVQYINCNNPEYVQKFGDLPTVNLVTGLTATIDDCNTTTWSATANGSGSNKVGVRYNGTNWTVFAV